MSVENKPPDRIFLQWHCEEHDSDWGNPEPGDVTWSPESIFGDDIEYLRVTPPIEVIE